MIYYVMERKHNSKLSPNAKALRKNMTKEERRLWFEYLHNLPVRFLRQKVIDGYIVDFYCSKARLIIELDGSQHYDDENIKRDNERTACFNARGLRVVRIPNSEINNNFRGVCEYIENVLREIFSASENPDGL